MKFSEADLDRNERKGNGVWPVIAAATTLIIGLAVGGAVGGAVGWTIKPAVVETNVVARELTDLELEAIWGPKVQAVEEDLDVAQAKVATLENDVKTKEVRVQALEAEMARRAEAGAELRQELENVRAELVTVKAQLVEAIAEKEKLAVELEATVVKLDQQKEQTRVAREETIEQRWLGFVRQAQLDVCEKGNRKKLGNCRETLTALMSPEMRAQYVHCIRSGQEAPSLHEAEKGAELPTFAQYLNEEERITKDWYVLMCDPTLPEARDLDLSSADASP